MYVIKKKGERLEKIKETANLIYKKESTCRGLVEIFTKERFVKKGLKSCYRYLWLLFYLCVQIFRILFMTHTVYNSSVKRFQKASL